MPGSRLPVPTGGMTWSAVAAPTPAPQPMAPIWERLSKPKHTPAVKPQGKDYKFGPCDGEARYPKPRWSVVGGRPVTKVANKPTAPSVNVRRAAKKPSSMATKIDWSTSKSVSLPLSYQSAPYTCLHPASSVPCPPLPLLSLFWFATRLLSPNHSLGPLSPLGMKPLLSQWNGTAHVIPLAVAASHQHLVFVASSSLLSLPDKFPMLTAF